MKIIYKTVEHNNQLKTEGYIKPSKNRLIVEAYI
jgi:hypothetical protein